MSEAKTVNRCYVSTTTPGLRLAEIVYAAGGRQKPHRHVNSTITLIVSGVLREDGPNGDHCAAAASVVFKPAGTLHGDVFGPAGARTLQIRLPAANVYEPFSFGSAAALERYRWVDGGPLARSILRLYRVFADTDISAELLLEESLCEIAAIAGQPSPQRPVRDCPTWMHRVVDRLSNDLSTTPLVTDLANEAGVHPVYLARAFRRHQRCSIREFLRRRRVGEVCRRLANSTAPLAAIALDSGFADQAHLCRVFRAELGLTPSAYRKLAQAR